MGVQRGHQRGSDPVSTFRSATVQSPVSPIRLYCLRVHRGDRGRLVNCRLSRSPPLVMTKRTKRFVRTVHPLVDSEPTGNQLAQ